VRIGPSTRTAFPAEERLFVERRQSRDLPFDQRPVAAASVDDLDGELFASTYLPAAVSRETIVNALVHRTYEANGSTRVLWFDDRIEVVNPGGPYGQVSDSNFDRINDYRNPGLAEAAKVIMRARR